MKIPIKPVIAIIGHKNSGKTLLIEKLVKKLVEKGYKVASVKHIGRKEHGFDMPRKDTTKHLEAGANPVIAITEDQIITIKKTRIENPIEILWENIPEKTNIVLLEGFSTWTLSNENIPKIICIKNREDLKEYQEKAKNTLLFGSLKIIENEKILHIIENFHEILDKTISCMKKQEKLIEVYNLLPGLNCGKCRFKTCLNLAKAILDNKASKEECVVLTRKKGIKMLIDGKEIPVTPFVEKIVKTTILSMLSTLKGVNMEDKQKAKLKIEVETSN